MTKVRFGLKKLLAVPIILGALSGIRFNEIGCYDDYFRKAKYVRVVSRYLTGRISERFYYDTDKDGHIDYIVEQNDRYSFLSDKRRDQLHAFWTDRTKEPYALRFAEQIEKREYSKTNFLYGDKLMDECLQRDRFGGDELMGDGLQQDK